MPSIPALFRRFINKQKSIPAPMATPQVNTTDVMSTGEVCARLGFNVTAAFLLELGFTPEPRPGSGKFWKASDFPAIVHALINHLRTRLTK